MTISPTLLSPDPQPGGGSSNAGSAGTDGFAAILAALGGSGTPGAPATPGANPGATLLTLVGGSTPSSTSDTEAADPEADPDASSDAATLAITASLAGLVSALAAHGTTPGPATTPPASLQALVGSVSGETTGASDGLDTLASSLLDQPGQASAAPAAPLTLLGHVVQATGQAHLSLLTPVSQPSLNGQVGPGTDSAGRVGPRNEARIETTAGPQGLDTLASSLLDQPGQALGAQPAAPVAATASGPSEAGPVVRQVVPELTRMVSRGEGTHRLWLKLNPDNLGEVRVVLTVKDGDVHVRIAGGTEAQNELLRGAPELHRLLASSGATQTRLELLDHAGRTFATSDSLANGLDKLDQRVPTDAGGDAQSQNRGQLAGGTGAEGGSTHSDRSARKQPGSDAMDGTGDPTPLSRPSQSVGSSRGNTGLDLTL